MGRSGDGNGDDRSVDGPHRSRFDEAALAEALEDARRLGFLGDRAISEVIEHARVVVDALAPVSGSVVDLGSGGGVPGLVIACDRPDLQVTLVDRRTKRTDVLERVVRRHGLSSRVTVVAREVEALATEVSAGRRQRDDAAVARGFGPPETTLRAMRSLVRPGGRLIVTEPPAGDRWDPAVLAELDVVRLPSVPAVAVFELVS